MLRIWLRLLRLAGVHRASWISVAALVFRQRAHRRLGFCRLRCCRQVGLPVRRGRLRAPLRAMCRDGLCSSLHLILCMWIEACASVLRGLAVPRIRIPLLLAVQGQVLPHLRLHPLRQVRCVAPLTAGCLAARPRAQARVPLTLLAATRLHRWSMRACRCPELL